MVASSSASSFSASAIALVITAAWIVTAYFCLGGLDFLNETSSNLEPPVGSASEAARREFGNLFPQKAPEYPFAHGVLVVAKHPQQHSIWSPAVADLSELIVNATLRSCEVLPKSASSWGFSNLCWWRQAFGIFLERESRDLDLDFNDLVSADNATATVVLLSINVGFGVAGDPGMVAAWDRLQAALDEWLGRHGEHFEVGSTHEQMELDAAQKAVISDFEHGDAVTLPIAWAILLYSCGAPAMLALVTLPVTLLVTFAVLSNLATGRWLCLEHSPSGDCATPADTFPDFVPAVFVDMMVAISFDYTLFLLTRFREETERGRAPPEAVRHALHKAGRVIVTSGVILMLSFMGLTRCSVDAISSIGWGGAVLCATAMAVHTTLLPSLLLLIGQCCSCEHAMCLPSARWRLCDCACCDADPYPDYTSMLAAPLTSEGEGARSAGGGRSGGDAGVTALRPGERDLAYSRWVQLGLICRDYRRKIIGGIGLLLVPCILMVARMALSANQDQLCPRDAPSLITAQSLPKHQLSLGLLQPLYVLAYNRDAPAPTLGCHDDSLDARQLVVAHASWALKGVDPSAVDCPWLEEHVGLCNSSDYDLWRVAYEFCPGTCAEHCDSADSNRSVLSAALWGDLLGFREALETELGLRPAAIRDVATLPYDRTVRVNLSEAAALLGVPGRLTNATPATPYQAQFEKYTSYNQTAALIEILLPDGPTGVEGLDTLRAIRRVAARERPSGSVFRVVTDVDIVLDMMALVLAQAPALLIGTTSAVTFVIAGLAFRSVLVPLRLLFTVVVTILFVVGLSAFAYQSVFPVGGLYWVVPMSCGCLMIGLSLDYDVFLISEIYELRHAGYSTEAAILRAMGTESGTITTAGAIMTVAFSSMLLSSTDVLNQWGLMLVSASLIDTFLVRTILVPSLMFCFVERNWWPSRVPPPIFHTHLGPSEPEPALAPMQPFRAGPDELAAAAAAVVN